MKFANEIRWKYKNNSKNGVMEIKAMKCLIRLSKKKRKKMYIYIVATFEKERTKNRQKLNKTPFQKLR